jgi:hypothetical protein
VALGAHGKPTNAAIEVPTAWIGLDPDATSSRYTPRALFALFFAFAATRATRPRPASAQPLFLIGPIVDRILEAPQVAQLLPLHNGRALKFEACEIAQINRSHGRVRKGRAGDTPLGCRN